MSPAVVIGSAKPDAGVVQAGTLSAPIVRTWLRVPGLSGDVTLEAFLTIIWPIPLRGSVRIVAQSIAPAVVDTSAMPVEAGYAVGRV